MQYTDLTRKELQREYSRLTRKYTDFIRQPVELDLTMEDSLPGCANRRAVKHFGTVLDKELRDTGAAHPAQAPDAVAALATMPGCAHRTVELCRKAGVRFDAIGYPVRRADPRCQRLCCQRPHGCIGEPAGNADESVKPSAAP